MALYHEPLLGKYSWTIPTTTGDEDHTNNNNISIAKDLFSRALTILSGICGSIDIVRIRVRPKREAMAVILIWKLLFNVIPWKMIFGSLQFFMWSYPYV